MDFESLLYLRENRVQNPIYRTPCISSVVLLTGIRKTSPQTKTKSVAVCPYSISVAAGLTQGFKRAQGHWERMV